MIRVFRETDIEELIEIINRGYIIKEKTFIEEIKDPNKKVFVYDDGKVKGFSYLESFRGEELKVMINIYVDPEERGKGIGTALYKETYKLLKEINPSTIMTVFNIDEKNFSSFYKKFGFNEWYGCYEMYYKGSVQPETGMEFIPYEDKHYEVFAKARQEGFYELRKENDIKPYIAFQLSEEDREKTFKIKDSIYLSFDKEKLIAVAHIEDGNIARIIVTPEYRGKGYGRKTTQFAINKALSRGEKLITLDVVKSNIRAISLYKSLGFEVLQNIHFYRIIN